MVCGILAGALLTSLRRSCGLRLSFERGNVVPTLGLAVLVGAFLLGAGPVVGGYRPGTALAGAAGGRLDALLFFVMMYPGYRLWLWLWLEPQVRLAFHAALAPSHLSLPDLPGTPPIVVLVGLGVACLLGWELGDNFEARSHAKGAAPRP